MYSGGAIRPPLPLHCRCISLLDGLVGFWRFYSLLTAFPCLVGSQNRVVCSLSYTEAVCWFLGSGSTSVTMVFFHRIVNYCQHSSGLTSCQHLEIVFRVRVMPRNILMKFEHQAITGRNSYPYKMLGTKPSNNEIQRYIVASPAKFIFSTWDK